MNTAGKLDIYNSIFPISASTKFLACYEFLLRVNDFDLYSFGRIIIRNLLSAVTR